MDEQSLQQPAGSVDAHGEEPMVDLLAELMGSWDEVPAVYEAQAASDSHAADAAVLPAALLALESAPEVSLALADAAADFAPEPVAEAASEPGSDFLELLLAEQAAVDSSSDALTNLAVSLGALTETTAPAPAEPELETAARTSAEELALEAADATEMLDSLFGDLARPLEAESAPVEAAPAPEEIPANAEKYVLFSLGETRYAVAIHQVIETDRVPQITHVPNVPEFVRGVINLRGDILSLIDLRTLWGLPPIEHGKTARLLVVRSSGEQLITGLLVDDVNGIAPIVPESLAVLESQRNERIAPLLRGVYEHHQQSLHVIDLERLFLSPEIQQLAAN